jgi:uncharacterized protein (TIGR02145 family)
MIALSALFLAGCNNEETLIDDLPPVEKGKLSFVLPIGSGGQVTYATTTPGLAAEYTLRNIRIYWFDETGYFRTRFGWGDGATAGGMDHPSPTPNPQDPALVNSSNNKTVVTIATGGYEGASRFYIIANVNDGGVNPNMITSKFLSDSISTGTTCEEFEAILSDALDNSGGSLKLLGTPLPMSISKSGGTPNGYIEIDNPSEGGTVNVEIKRRVARFDIINTADFSNFEITKIAVSRAQRRATLRDSVFTETASSWDDANVGKFEIEAKPLTYDSLAFNGPKGSGIDAGANSVDDEFEGVGSLNYDSCKYHRTKAAFYLYPTKLDKEGTRTQIALEGIYNKTIKRVYTLDIPDGYQIDANKIYRIHVDPSPEQKLQFTLTVDDWTDVDTVSTVAKGKDILSWGTLTSTADSTLNIDVDDAYNQYIVDKNYIAYEYSSSELNPDTLVFQTTGLVLDPDTRQTTVLTFYQKDGQTPGIEFLGSDFDLFSKSNINIVSSTVVTYAYTFDPQNPGTYYTSTHKIVLPPTIAPIEVKLQITNASNPQEEKFITLKSNNYNKTGYKTVKVGDLLWAPVNVGATKMYAPNIIETQEFSRSNPDCDSITGYLYQWGRNVGFKTSVDPTTTTGPLSGASLTQANQSNQFIVTSTNDWITTPDDDLWSGSNAQGPCPPGWRIPTEAEFKDLISKSTGKGKKNAVFKYPITATGEALYFPFAGRIEVNGKQSNTLFNTGSGEDHIVWCSTIKSGDTTSPKKPYRLAAGSTNTEIGVSETRNMALSVRAVRDILTTPQPVKKK